MQTMTAPQQKKDWSKYMGGSGGSGMGGMDFQQYMDYQLLGRAIQLSFGTARLSAVSDGLEGT